MYITKTLRIQGKIIKSQEILEMAKKLQEEYENIESSGHIKFTFKDQDGTQYDFDNVKDVERQKLLDKKRIVYADMRLYEYENKKEIEVKLENATVDSEFLNFISMGGNDELWVNGTYEWFRNLISHFKNQKMLWVYNWKVTTGIGIIFTILVGFIIAYISRYFLKDFPILYLLILVILPFLVLGFFGIFDKLQEIYPVVELITGPEHLQIENQKRKKIKSLLYWIATITGIILSLIGIGIWFLS